jgi:hypothetical protein
MQREASALIDEERPRRVRAARKSSLVRAWSDEMAEAREARAGGDAAREWHHLERAHILSQPLVGPHVRTHVAMLGAALRHGDGRETIGQLLRLVLAGPGSLTGRYPVGNTGGANVSPFAPMPIPEDLRAILEG